MNLHIHSFTKGFKNWISIALFKLEVVRQFWQRRYPAVHGGEIPWTPLRKPLEESKLMLITTGGVHIRSDTPFDMNDPNGDPSFRLIPSESAMEELMITHDYYDHRDADKDLNLVFPWQVVRALKEEGRIGGLTEQSISFMGHIQGPLLQHLIHNTSLQAADLTQAMQADIALLVPA